MKVNRVEARKGLQDTMRSVNAIFTEDWMRPSSAYLKNTQRLKDEVVNSRAFAVSRMVASGRRAAREGDRKLDPVVQKFLVAFYLAYASKHPEGDMSDILSPPSIANISYLEITSDGADEICKMITRAVQTETIPGIPEGDFAFVLNVDNSDLWGWAVGRRFLQYVLDTKALEELSTAMEA